MIHAVEGHVFISYSHVDRAYVEKLAAHLGEAGIPIWYDYATNAGERFDAAIEQQIDACAAMVVICTPEAMASDWVRSEILYAFNQGKPILPLMRRTTALQPPLTAVHYEDVTAAQLPSPRFVEQLRTLTGATSPGTAPVARRPAPGTGPRPAAGSVVSLSRYGVTRCFEGRSDIVAVSRGTLALHSDGRVSIGATRNKWGWLTGFPDQLSNVAAVARGYWHSLVLLRDGRVKEWDGNGVGQTGRTVKTSSGEMRVRILRDVVAISAGDWHSLALHRHGNVTAWPSRGGASDGVTKVPDDLRDVTAIAASDLYNLALLGDGRVRTWGGPEDLDTEVPDDLTDVVAIAAGRVHSLALHGDGRVSSWGEQAPRIDGLRDR
jgi:TIR domain/Regulator of chromosome condensation (RCC1) repeat